MLSIIIVFLFASFSPMLFRICIFIAIMGYYCRWRFTFPCFNFVISNMNFMHMILWLLFFIQECFRWRTWQMSIRDSLKTLLIVIMIWTAKILICPDPWFAIYMNLTMWGRLGDSFCNFWSYVLFLLAGTQKSIMFDIGNIVMFLFALFSDWIHKLLILSIIFTIQSIISIMLIPWPTSDIILRTLNILNSLLHILIIFNKVNTLLILCSPISDSIKHQGMGQCPIEIIQSTLVFRSFLLGLEIQIQNRVTSNEILKHC